MPGLRSASPTSSLENSGDVLMGAMPSPFL
jgi:hypothetical protein